MVKFDLVGVFKYTCKHHETHPTFIYKCKHVIFQYLIINSLKNTKIDALENNMSKTHVIMKNGLCKGVEKRNMVKSEVKVK
jgi:hypothetical protein